MCRCLRNDALMHAGLTHGVQLAAVYLRHNSTGSLRHSDNIRHAAVLIRCNKQFIHGSACAKQLHDLVSALIQRGFGFFLMLRAFMKCLFCFLTHMYNSIYPY